VPDVVLRIVKGLGYGKGFKNTHLVPDLAIAGQKGLVKSLVKDILTRLWRGVVHVERALLALGLEQSELESLGREFGPEWVAKEQEKWQPESREKWTNPETRERLATETRERLEEPSPRVREIAETNWARLLTPPPLLRERVRDEAATEKWISPTVRVNERN